MKWPAIFILLVSMQSKAQLFSEAAWIVPANPTAPDACPVFQKSFSITKKIQTATIYITAHGLYEATINGKRVGEAYFTPGWTNYHKRLQYQEYEVGGLLQNSNTVKITTAGGWYRGTFGGDLQPDRYGKETAILLELQLHYADGSTGTIVSDSTWQSTTGSILYSNLYQGETWDTKRPPQPLAPVSVKNFSKIVLVPTVAEPVTRQETFKPVKITGDTLIDFGQNLAGWVRLKIRGHKGDTVRVEHAEVLDSHGKFYTGNLREAAATDLYILNGEGQVLEPKFTYHGFRYAKVSGFKPTKKNCLAIAVHSQLRHTGSFRCSNPLINQLQHNIEWSLNSNFLDAPTDCPQRSERLGWTGDAQIFVKTATFNRDVHPFFRNWLENLEMDQGLNGAVPSIIPDLYRALDSNKNGRGGWGDAATIVPWTIFQAYGDTAILRSQYASMKAWVDYIHASSENGLWTNFTYGDWYAPGDSTSTNLVNQCFYAYSTKLLAATAEILNKKADVIYYDGLLEKAKLALVKNYFDTNGRAVTHTQTAYILPLQFDLLPAALEQKALGHLVQLIHDNNDHLSTGFLGTPYILNVLTKYGYTGLAYTILNQLTPPSWLYPVTKGATTIWEKWEAIRPDGSFDTCSLNHYAYGAVGDWLYTTVAGISSLAPGYKLIEIAPQPGGGLTWAKASYECPFGKIVCNWKIKGRFIRIKVTIPSATSARLVIPGGGLAELGPGNFKFKRPYGKK